jgi:pilus assembly protein CpaC
MSRLIFLLLLNLTSVTYADDLLLELGDVLPVPRKTQRIWIEKKEVVKAYVKNKQPYLKATAIGFSYLRLGHQLKSLYVLAPGSMAVKKQWLQWQNQFVGLKVDFCHYQICLKGRLYRLKDYQRIIQIFSDTGRGLPLALQISPALESELRPYLARQFRTSGYDVSKIIFAEPWKVLVNNTINPKNDLTRSDLLLRFGLSTDRSAEILNIKNNIQLSVKIVELSRNAELNYGLRWPAQTNLRLLNSDTASNSESLELSLNLAEKSGAARILASPNLLCRSGEEASFFAGGEIPIKTLGYRSEKIIWKKYGIDLRFKPLIDRAGQMNLSVEAEVSHLDYSQSADDIPAFQTHKVSSHFDLVEEKTVVLSGLIKSEQSRHSEGLPHLKNIPILGALFSSRKFLNNQTELIIFVTPRWMRAYE